MTTTKPKAMTIEQIEALEHDFIGPTWQKNPDGSWLLPDHTLGWQVVTWITTYLLSPDGSGKPFSLTREQLRFILWWYAVDADGRFVYRTGVLQRLKGWGKDPLLSAIAAVEFLGPSRPVVDTTHTAACAEEPIVANMAACEFDASYGCDRVLQFHGAGMHAGEPLAVAHPQAWVAITAVSQEQTSNTMALFPTIFSDDAIARYDIKLQAEIIRADRGRKRLQAVTSNYRALEGKRTTFSLLNETHHWVTGNGGPKMAETIDGNATKMKSRYLAITNAFLPGEESTAETQRASWQRIQDGRAEDTRMLYDSIEAHPATPLTADALRIVLPKIRGDAAWLDIEDIISSIMNTQIEPARSRRMFLNQIVAGDDHLYGPENWAPLEVEGALLKAGDPVVLGFDGGKSDDATVLVAIRTTDQVAFVLCLEEKPEHLTWRDKWEVDRDKVDRAVREAFRLYDVKAMYADVALWESYIDEWAELYREQLLVKASERHAIAWDMRTSLQRVTRAHERMVTAIFDGKLRHDGDADLRRHVLNVVRRENNYGVSFGKESRESKRKVDAYAAMLLAWEALHDIRTRAKPEPKKHSGNGWFL